MKLRGYQSKAVDAILARFSAGDQTTMCVLSTGGGKTIVMGHVAKHFLSDGRVMLIAHREELVRQAADKLGTITGVLPSIEKAGEFSDEENPHGAPPVVIASVQSLNSGAEDFRRMNRFAPSQFSLLLIDESHHLLAETWLRVLEHFKRNEKLKVLMVTATPDRADGEELGAVCQSVAFNYELPNIIHDGYLVPIRQRRVRIENLDFSSVSTKNGDLDPTELEEVMMSEKPLHGAAHATIEIACGLEIGFLETIRDDADRVDKLRNRLAGRKPRRTLTFTVSVAHAERIAEIFNRWIPESAAFVSGETKPEVRKKVLRDFKDGEISFLSNCQVATEGFDEPAIELVSIMRPTKSRALYSQMAGRSTRPAEDIAVKLGELPTADDRRKLIASSTKPFAEILDFTGNSGRHKLISTADILGSAEEERVIDRANEIAEEESVDMMNALETAKQEVATEVEADELTAAAAADEQDEEDERRVQEVTARLCVVATADYSSHYVSAFDKNDIAPEEHHNPAGASDAQRDALLKFGLKAETIKTYSSRQAGAVLMSLKKKRPSNPQIAMLRRLGFTQQEIEGLNGFTASDAIEAAKKQEAGA